MWLWIGLSLVLLAVVLALVSRKYGNHLLKDRDNFNAYAVKNNLSITEQIELCERFNLDHQIGHRAYDSVEDWTKELTVLWAGQSDDIEFTYRKYDDRERRSISPTEFGFDGNKRAYIKGVCHKSEESRTFKTARIETKLKVGAKRYDLPEWIENYLHLDSEEITNSLNIKL
ncbi:WYL domain-containing protein [Vibrio sp. 10N.261.54.A5]|uniref:WYL domain-containing protein n=1 Tax=Vibrio sp. 10N.261.54.A5 TaxID=3229686 RepID=UPI0035532971